MELVYLWVEKYKNIETKGFNFSPKFEFEYFHEKNELVLKKENKNYVNIFPVKINITAIVGENGSGKSSILEIIKYGINNFSNEGSSSSIYFALLYNKVNRSFSIKGNFENYKRIDGESKKLNEIDKTSLENQIIEQGFKIDSSVLTPKIHNIFLTKSSYYYPDAGDRNQLSEHLANISDEYLYEKFAEDIQVQYQHTLRNFRQITQLYYDNIFQNGLEAFYTNSFKLPKDWNKPNKVSISFNHSYVLTSFDNLLKKFKEKNNKTKYEDFIKFKALYDLHDLSGKSHYLNNWQYFFKYLSILNFIVGSYQGIGETINGKLIEESIKEIDAYNKNNSMDKLINFYSQIFTIDGDLYEVPKEYFSKVKEAIFTLEKFDNFYHNGEFSIMIENNFNEIINLIQIHKALTVSVAGFLSFRLSPYFSDGHQEFFNLFAKIYMAINTPFDNKKPKENDTILLLLDEPDNYLHPNWQKQFLNIFIDFLSKNYNQYNFQLLITSHSPFILSDLPKDNVIFLKDGKQVNPKIDTFGANIHTLLSHGFFMEDGLMGEFSKSKINQIINYLNDKESEITDNETAQKYINLIGEPILKKQLQNMLDSKRLSKIDKIDLIEQQIKELQEELKKIKK